MRFTLRPLIVVSALLSGFAVRYGPTGIEMWRVWARLHSVNDRLAGLTPPIRGSSVERIRLSGCDAEYVRAPGLPAGSPAILYFHGGGFVAGGLGTYRRFASKLSQATAATVLNVGYRLLPRSPITQAITDGVDGYRHLLRDGYRPEKIVFAGDSAGGGLTFLVGHAVLAAGLPPPAGLVGLSPWADLDIAEKLADAASRTDPVIPIASAGFVVDQLVAKGEALDAGLSAANLDLAGLPPSLIHVGTTEVLELDAVKLAGALARAGVPVTLKHWSGQVHVFQVLGVDVVPEARQALSEIGAFVRSVTSAPDDGR